MKLQLPIKAKQYAYLATDFKGMGGKMRSLNKKISVVVPTSAVIPTAPNRRDFTTDTTSYIRFYKPGLFPYPMALAINGSFGLVSYLKSSWVTGNTIATPINMWFMATVTYDAVTGLATFYENDIIIQQVATTCDVSRTYLAWVMRDTDTIPDKARIFERPNADYVNMGNTSSATRWYGQMGHLALGMEGTCLSHSEIKKIFKETKKGFGALVYNYPYDRSTLVFDIDLGVIPQGLTTDGINWFWGCINGDSVPGTIYKLNLTTGAVEGTLIDSAPPHAAGGDWRENHDTLIFSSGAAEVPEIWEINKTDGTKIREWDFTDVDYNRGALTAWDSGDSFYLFTSDASSNFKIRAVTCNDDGSYVLGDVWTSSSLGTPQGMDCKNGDIYLLFDHSTGIAKLCKMALNADGTATIDESWLFSIGTEGEGFTFLGDNKYFGDYACRIRRIMPR